jgi:hypothetical protein
MIKTGQVVNLVLGVGDSSKFNLLGGSFGEAGDVVGGAPVTGARFLRSARDRILRGGSAPAAGGSGSGTPSSPYQRDPRDRYRRQY